MAAPIHPNGGRPKGSPNKATAKVREAIATFADGNVDNLTSWLNSIAKKDPKDAFNCYMSVLEYHIPKLARQELTGKDGEKLSLAVITGVPDGKTD